MNLEEEKEKELEKRKENEKEMGLIGSEAEEKEKVTMEKVPEKTMGPGAVVEEKAKTEKVPEKAFPKDGDKVAAGKRCPRRGRKVQKRLLTPSEAVVARSVEIARRTSALLFPGLLKRKRPAIEHCFSVQQVSNANMERLRVLKVQEESARRAAAVKGCLGRKGKEKEKEMVEKMGKPELFVFGQSEEEKEKEKDPKIFVFGSAGNSEMERVTYYGKVAEETGSEIYFKGGVVVQVREEESAPEPEKIQLLHRVGGVLKVVDLRLEQKLGDLFGEGFLLHGELAEEGYFATLGGRLLDSNKSVANLGLQQGQEVVFHRRLRGGGFSGGGKGAREGRANSVAAGDWTCDICHQPGCWNAKSTCYRCGAPRHQSQGLSGQAISGARDMEGRYQGGVGTGMGGYRVIGPNGRDQSSIPGGNPTQRKGPQPGGKGRNKVGGDTGAGVGVGFGTGGGVVGGG